MKRTPVMSHPETRRDRGGLGLSIPRTLEACWLALAIATPAIFNPASLRVFEPEKIAFVRSVALLMLALRVIEALSNQRSPLPMGEADKGRYRRCFAHRRAGDFPEDVSVATTGLRHPIPTLVSMGEGPGVGSVSPSPRLPFLLPVTALLACYLLAALLSDLPQVSLLGSYRRQFGAITHLIYAAVFLVVATHLRTRRQATRLLLAIALGGAIPCIYALAQRIGVDPVPWSIDHSRRVVGTLGQPTFLGAYLAATIPASVWLLTQARSRLSKLGLISLVGLQTTILIFSQSRAAWLGALAGLAIVFLFSRRFREMLRRAGVRRSASAFLAALSILVVLNLPDTEANRLARSVPYLERIASLADFGSGSGRVRTLIWETMPALVAERPIIGHGPEMMGYAFERHYPPELAYAENRTASADAAHNLLLQQLVTAGVWGLAAYVWLIVSVVRDLTLTLSQRERGKDSSQREGESIAASFAVPALAGMGAGLVEGMAGVSSASAYLLFWLYLGLAATVMRGFEAHPSSNALLERGDNGKPPDTRSRNSSKRRNGPPSGAPVPAAGHHRWITAVAGIALLVVAGVGALRLNVLPLIADAAAAEGSRLASQGRFFESAEDYRRALELDSNSEYHLLLGQMAIEAAERPANQDPAQETQRNEWLRQGEEALLDAERLDPLDLDVALAQGKLYQTRAALLGRQDDWRKAVESFRRALGISPRRAYVHNRYGAALSAQGHHQEALAEYRISLKLDPNYAATHGFMGDSLVAVGRLQEALGAYLRARELDPGLVLVRINLGGLYLRLGSPLEAAKEYEAAVALAPDDHRLQARLAQIKQIAGSPPR